MRRILAFVVVLALCGGCLSYNCGRRAYLQELLRKGAIEVGNDNGLYNGVMRWIPTNTAWETWTYTNTGCYIDLPVGQRGVDFTQELSVLLYLISSYYPDGRYPAQVIVTRQNENFLRERNDRLQALATQSVWSVEATRFIEWRQIRWHQNMDVWNDDGVVFYRRDIQCSNRDVLAIDAVLTHLTELRTGRDLFPEMDAVIRRIINSIEPLNVTTNK